MSAEIDRLAPALAAAISRRLPGATGIADLRRLSGGAIQEIWGFRAVGLDLAGPDLPLILRRAPGGVSVPRETAIPLATEAQLITLAGAGGVPVPPVHHVLVPEDGLGDGFIMGFVEGETIARKILRDEAFAAARPLLARQCGGILARIHAIDTTLLPPLRLSLAEAEIAQYGTSYRLHDHPHPVFDLAFRWLEERAAAMGAEPTLVHGDFRNGNLMIGPDGVRAVLDWELAHRGDPMEDLGWISVNSWRFGEIDQPVGGFGSREDLFAGYEAAGGGPVDPARVRFWEVLGTLKWGIMCAGMATSFASGADRSIERGTIGRRASETEIDLLRLLAPRG